MDLSQIPIFAAMGQKMSYLSERQNVIAQNIANANTPGYEAMDVKKPSFNDLVRGTSGVQPTKTHSGHMTMNSGSVSFTQEYAKKSFDVTPTGNSVVLDEQLLKMAETAHDYQATTALYKKMGSLVKTALGERQ
jgi:flagellar basal-body rod protein FlgB